MMPEDIKSVSKVIMSWRDQILLLCRVDGKGWELPGGHLNRGERYIQGARREVFEETGISLTKFMLVLKQKDFRLFKAVPRTVNVKLSNEHTDYKWVNKRQFLKMELTKATKLNLRAILDSI